MNQRSTSITRKFKTDFNQQSHLDKKIHKTIRQKRQSINKMITPRVRGYKQSNYNYKQNDKSQLVSGHQSQKNKFKSQTIIDIDECFVNQFEQKSKNNYCVNHSNKVGSFESIYDRNSYYCYQCAINLVKMNIKVYKISSESQIIKLFLEEQFHKISQAQLKVQTKIAQYYTSLKENLLECYTQAHNALNVSSKLISFANFQQNDENIKKIQDLLGNIQQCHLKFTTSQDIKQNNTHKHINIVISQQQMTIQNSKQKMNKRNPNHSLQIDYQKHSRMIKDREYSYYTKGGQKSQNNRKGIKNQYKKSIYMR